MKQLLILNYHDIVPNNCGKADNNFTLRLTQFIEQLDLIEQAKIPIVKMSEWQESKKIKNLSVVLTFDDGYESHYHTVFPILQERNIAAVFFPTVSLIGQEGYLNWSHLQEIANNNIEIGSHGYSHKRLAMLSEKKLCIELVKSKQILQQKLNQSVSQFSLPYGVYTDKTLQLLSRAHYETVLTTSSIINTNKASFKFHRFNVKNNVDINHFRQLLSCNQTTIIRKKRASMFALAYNRLMSLGNLVQIENQHQ